MNVCYYCATESTSRSRRNGEFVCSACIYYFNHGGIVHPLPKYGTVEYDEHGKIICHVCGRSYHKVITHSIQKHNLEEKDYKTKFGLDRHKGLLSDKSRQIARERVYSNPEVIKNNLLIKGNKTRFVIGGIGRIKTKVSPQTMKRLKQQNFIKFNKT